MGRREAKIEVAEAAPLRGNRSIVQPQQPARAGGAQTASRATTPPLPDTKESAIWDQGHRIDQWFGAQADEGRLRSAGVKIEGGGPHQSKTMMLTEFAELLASGATNRPEDAVLRDNLLGKPSIRARKAALYRLRQLYGVGEAWPICVVLHRLWERDPIGRPMLALLCALARDPTLRAGAAAVLDAALGEPVRWPSIAAEFEAVYPRRLGEKMAKSLAQHAASTWTQAGFLRGSFAKSEFAPIRLRQRQPMRR
jgi:hypothetical protein